jgi:flavin reductase (DIM6/NTAB) family NADH-FMN oxidoreductase RutF
MSNPSAALLTPSTCNPDELRRALRHIGSTVYVIGLKTPDGAFFATTATAVTSVCLEPPTLAVCLNRSSAIGKHVAAGSNLSICALARSQGEISRACAGGVPHEEREGFFAPADGPDQLHIPGAKASFIGTCIQVIDVGTHALALVHITNVVATDEDEPLLYLGGAYGGFQLEPCKAEA